MTRPVLKQWFNKVAPVAQGPAKQHEFSLYVPPLMTILDGLRVNDIIDFQADEGVVATEFVMSGTDRHAKFIYLPPEMDEDGIAQQMTLDVTHDMRQQGKIDLVANLSDIATASADAILFNNILGCQGSLENVDVILKEADRIVRSGKYAIVTMPNVGVGRFSSYECFDVSGIHGDPYNFQMRRGPEDKEENPLFENIDLRSNALTASFSKHNFNRLVIYNTVPDQTWQGYKSDKPAFIQYVYSKSL